MKNNNWNNYNDYDNYNNYSYDDYYNDFENYNDEYIDLNLIKRIFAKLIDILIMSITHYLFVLVYDYYLISNLEKQYILIGLIIAMIINISIQYFIIPGFIFKGQSIGKKILRIRTIKKNGFIISIKDAFIEFIFVFLLPFDIIYCFKNKEFLHNKVCNTYVKTLY